MVQNLLKIDPKIDRDSKTEKVLHDIHGTRSLLAPLAAAVAHEDHPEEIQNRSSRDFGGRYRNKVLSETDMCSDWNRIWGKNDTQEHVDD